MSIGNSFNSFNMEQYLDRIKNEGDANAKNNMSIDNEDGGNVSTEQTQQSFDFKSAFEIYGDSDNVISDDVLSNVISKLASAVQIDTIRDIDKFVKTIDLTSLPQEDQSKTKDAIKSVLGNIAGSYGLSGSFELSASDFASFSIVSNIMFKSGKSDSETRNKLSDVMSSVVLGSNGNIDSILSKVSEVLGTDEHNDYIGSMLNNVAGLNSAGSSGVIARRDMWEFGKQTLNNYSQRIEIKKELGSATPDELETVNKNIKETVNILNSQLISGGEARYILDKIVVRPQIPSAQDTTPAQDPSNNQSNKNIEPENTTIKFEMHETQAFDNVYNKKQIDEHTVSYNLSLPSYFGILIVEKTDDNGKLVSKEEIVEKTNITRSISTYNENGKLQKKVVYDTDALTPPENLPEGTQWFSSGGITRTYTYDDKGVVAIEINNNGYSSKKTELPQGVDSDSPAAKFYMRHAEAKMISNTIGGAIYHIKPGYPNTIIQTDSSALPQKYEITLDNNGNEISRQLVEMYVFSEDAIPKTSTPNSTITIKDGISKKVIGTVEYDSKGRKTSFEQIHNDEFSGEYKTKLEYEYNESGMIGIKHYYFNSGKGEYELQRESKLPDYADSSWPSSRLYLKDADTAVISLGGTVYQVLDKYTLSSRSLTNPPLTTNYTVNDEGKIISAKSYVENKDGELQLTSTSKYEYKIVNNVAQEIIKTEYIDGAYDVITYSEGEVISSERYDSNGNLIKENEPANEIFDDETYPVPDDVIFDDDTITDGKIEEGVEYPLYMSDMESFG